MNNDHGNFVAANYTGHPYDTVIDMYFAEARFYDAIDRQWMSKDPIKSGLNWYEYCGSNPTSRWDPTGLRYSDGNPADAYRQRLEAQREQARARTMQNGEIHTGYVSTNDIVRSYGFDDVTSYFSWISCGRSTPSPSQMMQTGQIHKLPFLKYGKLVGKFQH